eukprot:jgi/Chlat1/1257/Chrsp115S01695
MTCVDVRCNTLAPLLATLALLLAAAATMAAAAAAAAASVAAHSTARMRLTSLSRRRRTSTLMTVVATLPSSSTPSASSSSSATANSSSSSSSKNAAAAATSSSQQCTLRSAFTRSGVGLHLGELAEVRVMPAAAGEGRYFACFDDNNKELRVAATVDSVVDTQLSTTLGDGAKDTSIRTVEHLLSALEGCGVDNARIELRGGAEVPLLDGSARDWVAAIRDSGVIPAHSNNNTSPQHSHHSRVPLHVHKPITVTGGDAFVAAFPANETRLTYGIDFPQLPVVGSQWYSWTPAESYEEEVAPARTFGILEQIEQLRAMGLIKGGSLENALVCSMKTGWVNPPLRFANEPCRHKLLDLIGDLALLNMNGNPGLPVAHVVAYKASHALHIELAKALLAETRQ